MRTKLEQLNVGIDIDTATKHVTKHFKTIIISNILSGQK